MEESKWMIVKREKASTKIKNCIKNFFSKIFGNQSNKKTKEQIKNKQEPREITIEYIYKKRTLQ